MKRLLTFTIYAIVLLALFVAVYWIFIEHRLSRDFADVLSQAESGNMDAQFGVGYMYEHGLGTDKNLRDALSWYFEAAQRGSKQARFILCAFPKDTPEIAEVEMITDDKWCEIDSLQID